MISYYELLGMIKNKTNPKKVKFDNDIYIWNNVNYECEYFGGYLCSQFNEAGMFEKNIEIINEYECIKEITSWELCSRSYTNEQLRADVDVLGDLLNEVIREVNKLRKDK